MKNDVNVGWRVGSVGNGGGARIGEPFRALAWIFARWNHVRLRLVCFRPGEEAC